MFIRLLTKADGTEYQKLRLESLAKNPDAFLTTFENEKNLHEDVFANHLDWAYHPPYFGYFGVFVGDNDTKLAGYSQVSQNFLEKQSHIAMINNVYFSPQWRGQGLATQLFKHIFTLLKTDGHIERIYLSCTASNHHAQHLYRQLGFQRYGVKVKAVKWQRKYDDEVEFVKVL